MIPRYTENEIEKLVNILKNDGVISVPTDTVYGVCAIINSKKAHDNLMKVKNRPQNKLFPVMCANEQQIASVAIMDENSKKLIKKFMPGPITIIMKANLNLKTYINNSGNTVAVRMATSKVLQKLIEDVGCPIFMSSANKSGEKTCTNLDEIEKACPLINGMLDGNVSFNQASTIVDCTLDKIKIIRPGPISYEQIMNALK